MQADLGQGLAWCLSEPLQHCNVTGFISHIHLSTDIIDTFQFFSSFSLQWTNSREPPTGVWAETPQQGEKQTGENLTWQKDVACLENITAWCDELTHWQHICLYQSRAAAAPTALSRTWRIGFGHFRTAWKTLPVKSLKSSVQTWQGVVEFDHMTLVCPSSLYSCQSHSHISVYATLRFQGSHLTVNKMILTEGESI